MGNWFIMPNGSVAAAKFSPVNRSIVERIVSRAITHGDSVAVYDGATKLTYKELISWAAALSEEIGDLPDRESPVGILLPSSAAYIVAILALFMAGRTAVPMDASHPALRNRRIIDRAGLGAVIVDSETAPLMREIATNSRQILTSPARAMISVLPPPRAILSPDHICMISFTSGSTSEPKGIFRSEKSLSYWLEYFGSDLALTADDRVPFLESVSAAIPLNLALNSLLSGAQAGIIDLKRAGLSTTRRLLGEFRPTIYGLVPSTFRALFEPDDAETAGLACDIRLVRLTGEPVRHSDVDLYRRRFAETCRLLVGCGSSEAGYYASWYIDHTTPIDSATVPVGYPWSGVELELIGEDGLAVGSGEIGEIFVTSPALAVGYWRDEALTKARFSPSTKNPGMFRNQTGDLGRFLPNGLLEFIGRRDRQVKIRGNTVHPGDVEAVLVGCPNVAEVGVIARQSADGTVLVAYCTPTAGAAIAEDQLRRWCRDHLPAPMRPTHFFMLAALPKLPNGKLDLIELAALDARQVLHGPPMASPEAPAKPHLAGIVRQAWTGVLSAESFDTDIAFDAAGGDSLKGLELIGRLEALLCRHVPVGTLGLETRPTELIRRLSETSQTEPAPDDMPLIVLFPGLWGDDVSTSDFYHHLSRRFGVMAIEPRLGGDALIGDYEAARYFAAAIAAIRSTGPPRRLWLVGHSYGGKLAAEIARRLLASGTGVEAIIVLDTELGVSLRRLNAADQERRRGLGARLRSGPTIHGGVGRYLLNAVAVRVAPFVVRCRANRVLRSLLALVVRFGSAETYRLVSRSVIKLTHHRAFGDLPAGALPMALWLFVADDSRTYASRPDLGWSDWCQEVHKVSVGGTHRAMLSPPTRDIVIAELARIEVASRAKSRKQSGPSINSSPYLANALLNDGRSKPTPGCAT
jgi:acyl-CoA synthetase (AMP-forming)/AMP-acid ligase II/thioesterase domain-containing protein